MSDNDTRIAVLERDISNITGLFGRLDSALDKLTDISGSIKQLLAVHDQRLNNQEKVDEKLNSMIEKSKQVTDNQYEALHKRIGEVKDELYEELDKRNERIEKAMESMQIGQDEHHRIMLEKVSSMDKYKWIIIGGAVVVGYIISNMEFIVTLLK